MKNKYIAALLIFLTACCGPQIMLGQTIREVRTPADFAERPHIALALGGGAFHGPAHVGVIKALEEHGIKVDYIAGTSAGSLVGAMYADKASADSLMVFIDTKAHQIFDFSVFRSRQGFISGKKLQKYIGEHCTARNIEELRIPFAAVATDLIAGESIVLTSGPVAPSVNASCAIPFVFEPVRLHGKILVDGGVLNNVPANVCKAAGAEKIIAVDIMALGDTMTDYDSKSKILMRSLGIASGKLKVESLSKADIVIIPDLRGIPYMSGAKNRDAYDSGYRAAIRKMPEILKILGR